MGCGVWLYLTRVYRGAAYTFYTSMNTWNKIIRDGALDSPMLDLSFKLIMSVVTRLPHARLHLNGSKLEVRKIFASSKC